MYDKDTLSGDGNAANLAKRNLAKATAEAITREGKRTILAPHNVNPDKVDAIRQDRSIRERNRRYLHKVETTKAQVDPRLSKRQIARRRARANKVRNPR